MNVHPLRPPVDRVEDPFASPPDEADPPFPHDFHPDFDDADETLARFGSVDRQYRYAHRTISSTVLSALTGVSLDDCQEFHWACFGLLEHVGDFDGLVAVPPLLVVGRDERAARASRWLEGNPPPSREAIDSGAEDADEPFVDGEEFLALIERHSLDLALASDSNPSLTFGSSEAFERAIGDRLFEVVDTYCVNHVSDLIAVTLDQLARLPDSVRPLGGATVIPLESKFIPLK